MVRIACSLAKKPPTSHHTPNQVPTDPFENPSSQKLFGGPITASHSFIFNKFNLVDDHMVVVTNEFESQYDPLSLKDMEAIWKCLVDLGGMGFFNGGRLAGASQPHKHLQFLPTPLVPGSQYALPIESVLLDPKALASGIQKAIDIPSCAGCADSSQSFGVKLFTHPSLPFFNLFGVISEEIACSEAPGILLQTYREMLRLSKPHYEKNAVEEPHCFNLLILKKWILFVPRSKECLRDTTISINSMGFAGTLFVKSTEHFEVVKQVGPMGVLQALTLPSSYPSSSL